MRKLFALTVSLIVVVAVLAAIAAANLNSYLFDNKDWIAEQVEESLNRPVQFDSVGLSFRRGLAVEILGFRVGEDERFGEDDFLTIGRTFVRVALWPALFGRVEVSKISLGDVSLTLIQTEMGLSTDSLGATPAGASADQPAQTESAPASSTSTDVDAITIAMAEIRSGRLRYIDKTGDSDREVVIDQLDFWTTDVAPGRPIQFQLTGEMLGAGDTNLRIHGQFGPLAESDSDETPIDIRFSLDPVDAGALLALAGSSQAMDPKLALAGSTLKFSGIVSGSLEDPNLKLVLDAFGGTVEIEGGWGRDGRLDLETVVSNIELGELTRRLAESNTPLLDGSLSMRLTVTGIGETWSELAPGLEGLGTGQIDSGILHDINLFEEAVAGLTGVPGLSEKLPEKIYKKYPELFSSGDTEFDRMDAKLEVREGRVHILGIQLEAKDYGLRGWGSLSLAGDLDLSTRIVLSAALTSDLIDKVRLLKHLRGDDGRIEIPVQISGVLPDVSAKPDSDAIAKQLGAGAADKLAKKSFKKLMKKGKKKGDARESTDAGRELLERLLR